jgi:hypothetical protein
LVERNLAKVEVASSRLVSRSSIPGKAKLVALASANLKVSLRGSFAFPFLFESLVGGVAEWSCSGLQSRVRRFDSDPRLQLCCPGGVIGSRWGLKIPWPQGRAGSTPAPGTNVIM